MEITTAASTAEHAGMTSCRLPMRTLALMVPGPIRMGMTPGIAELHSALHCRLLNSTPDTQIGSQSQRCNTRKCGTCSQVALERFSAHHASAGRSDPCGADVVSARVQGLYEAAQQYRPYCVAIMRRPMPFVLRVNRYKVCRVGSMSRWALAKPIIRNQS